MLKIDKNSLDNIQLGQKKKNLPKSIINSSIYFLEFDRLNKVVSESKLITISVRYVEKFEINGMILSFENLNDFLKNENPLVENDSSYIFPQYNLSLYINWNKKIFNEILIYDKSLKKIYEKASFLTYEQFSLNQEIKKEILDKLLFVPYTALGKLQFGKSVQLFAEENNFKVPQKISQKEIIEFRENILIRFDREKLTQITINNINISILYRDLNIASQSGLNFLLEKEKYVERNSIYVFVNIGVAITKDLKSLYFFDKSLLVFWENKHRPITSW